MATVCHKQQTIKSNRRLTACIRTAIATAKALPVVAQSLICSAEYLLRCEVTLLAVGSTGRCNTQALNRSARVSKAKVSRDRSLSCRVTRLNCECAPPAVPQLLLGHPVETSNISSTYRHPLHLLRLR